MKKKLIIPLAVSTLTFSLFSSSISLASKEIVSVPSVIDAKYEDEYSQLIKNDLENNTLSKEEKDIRKQEYLNKYSHSAVNNDQKDEKLKKELDKSFEEKQKFQREKEKKAGKVINKYFSDEDYSNLAVSITKEDKIKVMHKAVELLEQGSVDEKEEALLKFFLYKFAPYAGDNFLKTKAEKIKESDGAFTISASSANLDRTKTDAYVDKYYTNYNTPTYPDLTDIGGDCANFVSQALKAGGATTDTKWYIKAKQSPPKYVYPQNVTELDYSWDLYDPSPWISAEEFNQHWDGFSAWYFSYTPSEVKSNHSSIYSDLWRGDVIQITKKVNWWFEGYHTMIVSSYVSGDLGMSYHTTDTNDKPLLTIVNTYSSSDYRFDFFEMKEEF